VYVDGRKQPNLTLTSDFDWFYGVYPFTNNPADLHGHHMYDDVRTLFGRTLPAGTQVRFEIANPSIPVTINVADFQEVAPPAPQPRGSVSVLSYGADPTGQTDSTTAIQNAIDAGSAEGKAVYIPPGNYTVTAHLIVNNVTLTGAGEWYSVLGGNGVGVFGNMPPNPSTNVHLSNFAIYGQVQARVDSDDFMGIGGALQDSTIRNVWIQHVQAGIWMTRPSSNLKISNVRIQDTGLLELDAPVQQRRPPSSRGPSLAPGALRRASEPVTQEGWSRHILADPDGNEFCVRQPPAAYWQR